MNEDRLLCLLDEIRAAYGRLLIPTDAQDVRIDGLRIFYGSHGQRRDQLIQKIDAVMAEVDVEPRVIPQPLKIFKEAL